MNDLIETLMPLLIIAVTLVMGVFFLQLVNDPACASLNTPGSHVFGKPLLKVLMLCW